MEVINEEDSKVAIKCIWFTSLISVSYLCVLLTLALVKVDSVVICIVNTFCKCLMYISGENKGKVKASFSHCKQAHITVSNSTQLYSTSYHQLQNRFSCFVDLVLDYFACVPLRLLPKTFIVKPSDKSCNFPGFWEEIICKFCKTVKRWILGSYYTAGKYVWSDSS